MITPAPNLIEQSDFTGGWSPDQLPAALPMTASPDVLNLLPEPVSGALQTRNGFKRVIDGIGGGTHRILSIANFWAGQNGHFIMVIVTDGTANANNVKVFAVDVDTWSADRVDTPGRTWTNPLRHHWGLGIQQVWYGGVSGDEMYSWDPAGSGTWNDDAGTDPDWEELVDDVDGGVGAGEVGRDYAFTGKETVIYGSKHFSPITSIRYDTWEEGQHYSKGVRVSIKSGLDYWKSFRCIDSNNGDAVSKPGSGANQADFWEKVRLPLPQDEDGTTSDRWNFVPLAAHTSVAAWHGERLWLRYDNSGDKSRVQFSSPMKFEHGQDIADLEFKPTQFAPGTDESGNGGGWINVNDGRGHGTVTAMHDLGQYLVLFKRGAVWVLSGLSEESFNIRKLDNGRGCVGPEAVCEHAGLVYYVNEDGLYVTDGTQAEPVESLDNVRAFMRERIGQMLNIEENYEDNILPRCWSFGPYVFVSLPLEEDVDSEGDDYEPYVTVAYHPETRSFWKLDLPVVDVARLHVDRVEELFFAAPDSYGASQSAIYQYAPSGQPWKDDDGENTEGTVEVTWHHRSAWFSFGVLREQRRVRRVWAVIKGNMAFVLRAYKDWSGTVVATTTTTIDASTPKHIEGEWIADSHAVALRISGTESPAALHGYAIDTEPRRKRYHVS